MSIARQIIEKEREFYRLLMEVLHIKKMIPGTFKEVYRKCGKAYCWCATKEKGHPLKRITWSEKGKKRTKSVSEEDVLWATSMTANFRSVKVNRQKLRKHTKEIAVLLDQFERKIIEKTRKEREL